MINFQLKNVFLNTAIRDNIFNEVIDDLKNRPISSVKNLKKYFRLVVDQFAENINGQLVGIFNHPNILDYKNVSFQPYSRAEYENVRCSSFNQLDCNHEDAEDKNDATLLFSLYFNIPITKSLPDKILIELQRIFSSHIEEIKLHLICPTTKKTLYQDFFNEQIYHNITTRIEIDLEQKQLKVKMTNGC